LPLPVSVPSHCELMRPAAERFAESIAAINWQAPQIPLVQNVSAAVAADLDTLKRDLLEQLYKPVRWVESVQTLAANGATELVECGPGKVLAGLNKRCADGVSTSNLNTPDAFAAARAALA
jgi:[acyl-carrier-protein] S-malonyltransferase